MGRLRDSMHETRLEAEALFRALERGGNAVQALDSSEVRAALPGPQAPGGGGGGEEGGAAPPPAPGLPGRPPSFGQPRSTSGGGAGTGGGRSGGAGAGGGGKSRTVQYGWINSITGGPAQLHPTLLEFGQPGTYPFPQFQREPREVPGWWMGGHFYPDPEAPSPWLERSGRGAGGGSQQGTPRGAGGGAGFRLQDAGVGDRRLHNIGPDTGPGAPGSHRLGASTVSAPGVEAGVATVASEIRALRQAVQGDGGAAFRLDGGLS